MAIDETTLISVNRRKLIDSKFGIYKITNLSTGKIYVGSTTTSFKIRWALWRSSLNKGNYSNKMLQRAWIKYGAETFSFDVLEVCTDKESVLVREQHWINVLKPEYNCCLVAGSRLGCKHTEESKRKISESKKGIFTGGGPQYWTEDSKKRVQEGQRRYYERKKEEKLKEKIDRLWKGIEKERYDTGISLSTIVQLETSSRRIS